MIVKLNLKTDNCEICSNLDQCSYKQCTDDYYKENKEVKINGSNNNADKIEFDKLSNYARFAENQKKENLRLKKTDSEIELESELEKFLETFKDNDSFLDITSDYSLNFDLSESDSINKSRQNLLLYKLENRLAILKHDITSFLKINIQTSLFKKNVVRFYLFLKLKYKNHKSLDNKILIEKNHIDKLKQSALEIIKIQKKVGVISNVISKLLNIKESKEKFTQIKKLTISLNNLCKELDELFKRIMNDNKSTSLSVFKKSIFNNEMYRVFKGTKSLENNLPSIEKQVVKKSTNTTKILNKSKSRKNSSSNASSPEKKKQVKN